ncbi:hypothetical protein ACMFMG_010421 [Clarireedia jacksonii]
MPPPNTPTNGTVPGGTSSTNSRPTTPPPPHLIFDSHLLNHIENIQRFNSDPFPPVPNNTPSSSVYSSPEHHHRSRRYSLLDQRIMEVIGEDEHPERRESDNIDYWNLTYVGTVDQNLMCPICHVPFVDPVTIPCDHTFCKECITQALDVTEKCPMDRIICQQVEALLVVCPCCQEHLPRSKLRNHFAVHCKGILVECLKHDCQQLVKRGLVGRGCLHYDAACPDCDQTLQQKDMLDHREYECKARCADCEQCGETITRLHESDHIDQCPEGIAVCQWAEFGCEHECKRKDLPLHKDECPLKLSGPWCARMKAKSDAMEGKMVAMADKNQLLERRIKFLENGLKDRDFYDIPDVAASPSAMPLSESEAFESPNQYLLSIVESQQSKITALTASMAEMEARQNVMLFNETIPMKDQLAELRNNQSTIGMHVRWLMNFRLRENQRRGGATEGGVGGSDSRGGAGSSDREPPRRLSDSTRENSTKL